MSTLRFNNNEPHITEIHDNGSDLCGYYVGTKTHRDKTPQSTNYWSHLRFSRLMHSGMGGEGIFKHARDLQDKDTLMTPNMNDSKCIPQLTRPLLQSRRHWFTDLLPHLPTYKHVHTCTATFGHKKTKSEKGQKLTHNQESALPCALGVAALGIHHYSPSLPLVLCWNLIRKTLSNDVWSFSWR